MGNFFSKVKGWFVKQPDPSSVNKDLAVNVDNEIELGFGGNLEGRRQDAADRGIETATNLEFEKVHDRAPKTHQAQKQSAAKLLLGYGMSQQVIDSKIYSARILHEDEDVYSHILAYVKNGQEHGYGIKLKNLVRIVRNGEKEFHHSPSLKHKKRMLLWHGSNLKSILGIIEHGFTLPKPKNQMFGQGIYFADRISKSCNYCCTSGRPTVGSTAYLLICDVLLGNVYNAKNPHKNLDHPPQEYNESFDSLMCTGSRIPDMCFNKYYHDSIIPCGPTTANTRFPTYSLNYNEYIVYEQDKVRIQFLVEVEILPKPVT